MAASLACMMKKLTTLAFAGNGRFNGLIAGVFCLARMDGAESVARRDLDKKPS
jgi:hypothetical protein